MAEFEAPTFSLGFDFGIDSETQPTIRDDFTCDRALDSRSNGSFRTIEDDDDDEGFGSQVAADSDPENGSELEPPRILRRLRRGVAAKSISERNPVLPEVCGNADDDIEDFSSQEDLRRDEPSSFMCSSSKFPLQGFRVLSTQTTSHSEARKRKQVSNDPASANLGTRSEKFEFPKLTISPLRRFQLIDSDSDDFAGDDNPSRSSKIDSYSKERKPNPGVSVTASEERRAIASTNLSHNKDLWKDLSPMKSFRIPTPALDEVCEEYFKSVNERNVARKAGADVLNFNEGCCENKNSSQNIEQHWSSADSLPPAHRYFFHEDSRIQKLVRSRLSNFSPLGGFNQRANKPGASVIDYMGQFNHGEASKKQDTQNTNVGRTSTKGRKKSIKSNAEEISQASGSWVNPKSRASIPKDAGRRRVHADAHSSGHWYAGPEGRKVYVTKSGKELTGQIAYRHYRKESGATVRKSKKKTRSKKR